MKTRTGDPSAPTPHKKIAAGTLASRRLARRASRRRGYRECHALAGKAYPQMTQMYADENRPLSAFYLRHLRISLTQPATPSPRQTADPNDWKPIPSIGPGVREIRIHTEGAYRVFYVAAFEEAIYVLHAFEKKTRKTAVRHLEIGRQRFRALVQMRQHEKKRNR